MLYCRGSLLRRYVQYVCCCIFSGVIELSIALHCHIGHFGHKDSRQACTKVFIYFFSLLTKVFVTKTSEIERKFNAMLSSITP